MKKVNLKDIISSLEQTDDQTSFYLNKNTYKIEMTFEDYFTLVDNLSEDDKLEGHPDWEKSLINLTRDILYGNDYISLPDKYEINEYDMMKKFLKHLPEFLFDSFYDALHKKSAFRNFHNLLNKHHLNDKWLKYRYEKYKDIAIYWCLSNKIKYIYK
ncbi:MAG: hypothetical protein WC907_07230 [Acholeplasmataceae bacterium]